MGTLTHELNRLAGTTGLEAQGAANAWASTADLDLVEALNIKAGNALPDYLELQGVLNQLAGTKGLGIDEAASAISGAPVVDQGLKQAISAAIAGTGQARVLFVGDSYVAGGGATDDAHAFTRRTIIGLRSVYGIAGNGIGLQDFYRASAQSGAVGATLDWNQAVGAEIASGSVTWSVTGDSFDLRYCDTSSDGSFAVTIDGGAPQSVTTNGTYDISRKATFSLGADAAHTVEVSGSGLYIDGVTPYTEGDSTTSGITNVNCGGSGFTSDGWNWRPAKGGWHNLDPQLVVVHLCINDSWQDITPSSTTSNITELVQYIKALPSSPTVIFVAPFATGFADFYDDGSVNSGGYSADNYRDAALSAALAAGAYTIDMRTVAPNSITDGLVDSGHPTNAGHQAYADALVSTITSLVPA